MSVQTEYKSGLGSPYVGMVDTMFPHKIMSRNLKQAVQANGYGNENVPAGKAMMPHRTAADAIYSSEVVNQLQVATPWIQGFGTFIHTGEVDDDAGNSTLKNNSEFGILVEGVIWLKAEDAFGYGADLSVCAGASVQNATNQEKVGNVAGAAVSGMQMVTGLGLRSLGASTGAGDIVPVLVFQVPAGTGGAP